MGVVPPLRPRAVSAHLQTIDAILAAGLALGAVLAVWLRSEAGVQPLETAAALGATLPLALRRRAPMAVLATIVLSRTAHWMIAPGADTESLFEFLALPVALYSVAAHEDAPRVAAAGGLAVAALVYQVSRFTDPDWGGDVGGAAIVYLIAIAAGRAMGRREGEAARLRAERSRLERQRQEAARDERLRLARELHDVVGHSVSVMVLHAGASARLGNDQAIEMRHALETIERVGREAVAELQRVLELMREDGDRNGGPAPNLESLDVLLEPLVAADLEVQLQREGDLGSVPSGVALCAYRILQEALTNVLRHSGASRVAVAVQRRDGRLDIAVEDDGRGLVTAPVSTRVGHGLIGMHERVKAFGGTLEVVPGNRNGVAVRASIPLATHG